MTDALLDHPALVIAGRLRARLSAGQSYRWAHLDDPEKTEKAAERWRGLRDEYLFSLGFLRSSMSEEDLTLAATQLNETVRLAWVGGDWEADWAEPNGRYMAAFDALHEEQAARTLALIDKALEVAAKAGLEMTT